MNVILHRILTFSQVRGIITYKSIFTAYLKYEEDGMIQFVEKREFSVIGLGEVMLRLSPGGSERITHSETFEKHAGGSELNVVSGVAQLGLRTGIITKLPHSEIGKFARRRVRYCGVSDDLVIYDRAPSARLGIYYYESGAYPRLPTVFYDRAHSSFTALSAEELPESVFSSTQIFHTSGITMALSEQVRTSAMQILRRFSEAGATVSFDVNYRASLWDEVSARREIEKILPYAHVLFISEETLRRMFDMSGELSDIQRRFHASFPNLSVIASTRRRVTSPHKHSFSSLVYDCDTGEHFEEAPYEGIDVVDRIGSGDAYVAGALYGLLAHSSIREMALYGDAMAALKMTVLGDTAECDISDIDRIISAGTDSGPKSEMIR